MSRKIFAFVLTGFIAFSLTACYESYTPPAGVPTAPFAPIEPEVPAHIRDLIESVDVGDDDPVEPLEEDERIFIEITDGECWLCLKATEIVESFRAGHSDGFDFALRELGRLAESVENFMQVTEHCHRVETAEVYETAEALYDADVSPMVEGKMHIGTVARVHYEPESMIEFVILGED